MTVSIIIPTYNRRDLLLERAIPSVLAQTDPDWECHVVGDGTDKDTQLAMAAVMLADSRFRFTNLKRQDYGEHNRWSVWGLLGLEALNYGLDNILGDWVAVLNDDDEFTADHNELLLSHERPSTDFIYGKSITPSGQVYGAWPPGDGQLTQGSYIYRGRALEYRYDLDCLRDRALNGDADMWTRMYADDVAFAHVPKIVHHYFPSADRGEA